MLPDAAALLSDAALARLRARLLDAGYSLDAVMERLGEQGHSGLGRNSTLPARDALDGRLGPWSAPAGRLVDAAKSVDAAHRVAASRPADATDVVRAAVVAEAADAGVLDGSDAQASLIRLWVLQDAVPRARLRRALGSALDDLEAAGLLVGSEGGLRASVVVRPYGAEASASTPASAGWICHDPLPNLDGRSDPPAPNHVLGVSPASTTLAQLTIRRPVGRALDLGTGCGVQTLHLAAHAGRVVATDLNPRALSLARLTLGLSGVDADLRLGSLYEPVAGEQFDLIVSNPPFVIAPPAGAKLTYREGSLPGDELVRRVVVDGAARLAPDGTMQVLCNWAILAGQSIEERLAGWIAPTGCDALVLQRERLDPYEYVEMWLSDAGLDRTPEHPRRYRAWLDYLAGLGIEGIGLGWISVRNAGRARPDVRVEEWPFDVVQPVGEAFAAQHRAVDLAARDDAALLATRWRTRPGVVQETLGRPGAADPEHLVLRQSYGLARAVEVDTALAALVGACDGELTASEIVGALAHLLEVDAAALADDITPRLRALVADGYLDC